MIPKSQQPDDAYLSYFNYIQYYIMFQDKYLRWRFNGCQKDIWHFSSFTYITSSCIEEKITSSYIEENITSSCLEENITSSCIEENIRSSCIEENITSSCIEENIISSYIEENIRSSCIEETLHRPVQTKTLWGLQIGVVSIPPPIK